MIIECPACATRYELPDTAIGPDGRKVRCVKCQHSWHAFPLDEDRFYADGSAEFEATASDAADDAPAIPTPVVAHDGDITAPQAPEEAQVDAATAAPLADEPNSAPGPGRRLWLWVLAILAIMLAVAGLAVTFWGMPEWVPGRSTEFADAPEELVLNFPDDQQGRRQLPNGTEIFGASGTITNAGGATQSVPPILIVLRDSRERIVYSWEVMPPKRSLAPGESMVVNEAVTDAPRSAHFADIGWKPG